MRGGRRQILHIDVSSFRPTKELRFVPFTERPNKIFAMPISQWHVLKTHGPDGRATGEPAEITVTPEAQLMASADGLHYPRASFEIRVERQCEFYLWNMVVVNFALVEMAFAVYAIPPADIADRLAVNLTLVLTVVAFKFTFAGDMPKKAYLTWCDARSNPTPSRRRAVPCRLCRRGARARSLATSRRTRMPPHAHRMDKYMITGFVVLVLQAAECFAAAKLEGNHFVLHLVEHIFQLAVFLPWTLYHLYIACFSRRMYLPWDTVRGEQKVQVIL